MKNLIPTIRGAAHDIRGLLASASLATERLSEHEDQQVTLRARTITKAISQIVEICKTDLTEACIADKKATHNSGDIRSIIDQISFLISPHFDNSLSFPIIKVDIDDDLSINCNRAYLFRIIYNLTINAVNAIRNHSGTTVKIKVEPNGEFINVFVEDDGPGLPQNILNHLYPSINQTSTTGIFTSYGLMTTIAMINEMDGHLHLIHTSSMGTKFCIMLPSN